MQKPVQSDAVAGKVKRSELTCQRILVQAELLFSEKGVAGTSLRSIAENAGMKAGTILHHFPGGKEQLFNELVQSIFDQLLDQIASIESSNANIIDSIKLLASVLWDYFEENPKHAKIILREAMEANSEAFEKGRFQARLISKAAKTFMQEGAQKGQLAEIDAESFILSILSHVLVYHSSSALKNMIYEKSKIAADKKCFLSNLQMMLL